MSVHYTCHPRVEARFPGVVITLEDRDFNCEEVVTARDGHLVSMVLARPPHDISMQFRAPGVATEYLALGAVTVLPAGMEGHAIGMQTSTHLLLCHFQNVAFEAVLGSLSRLESDAFRACADMRQTSVRMTLQSIAQELLTPGFASELMIPSLSGQLAVELARQLNRKESDVFVQPYRLSVSELNTVKEYVSAAIAGKPSLVDAARLCGMTPSALERGFRASMGQSFATYVASARLTKAQELLTTSNLPLKEISYRVGFSHVSSFTTAFKRETRETPRAFRLRYLR